MSSKKTIKDNYTGGKSIRHVGDNPTPKTAKDIQKVYDNASEGSAFYKHKEYAKA